MQHKSVFAIVLTVIVVVLLAMLVIGIRIGDHAEGGAARDATLPAHANARALAEGWVGPAPTGYRPA